MRKGEREGFLSEEELRQRRQQAESLANSMGFAPGSRVTVVHVRNSPYGQDFVIQEGDLICDITGVPGDKEGQVSPETVFVCTKTGNYRLSDLSRWRVASRAELQAEVDRRNHAHWQNFGYKPDGINRFRHEAQIVLRELPCYYRLRRVIHALGLDII